MEKTKHIVILAAGDFPTHPVPLHALLEADFVVCCDSAYGHWAVNSGQLSARVPFVVIGDGDSIAEADKQALGDRWLHMAEQDYNDLHKAMSWAASRFSIHNSQFTILAATGRREDHTLGNIAYLATFAEEYPGIEVEMLTDYGCFSIVQGCRTFPAFLGQQVSLFATKPDKPVTAAGLRWPLDRRCLDLWWQGTLNEALSDSFTVIGDMVIVFQTYEAKR